LATLAQVIKARRKVKGFSQTKLAAVAGVTQQVVSDLERGRTLTGSVQTLRRLSQALEVDLFCYVGDDQPRKVA
jgi:transcriptional regulator with XRE-family HTH domain